MLTNYVHRTTTYEAPATLPGPRHRRGGSRPGLPTTPVDFAILCTYDLDLAGYLARKTHRATDKYPSRASSDGYISI